MRKPDSIILFSFLLLFLFSGTCFAMTIEKGKEVNKNQTSSGAVRKQIMDLERERVIERANGFLGIKPTTVTANSCPRSAGGKHDFFSEGPYWWPDPANPDGPFIRQDGLRYPGRFENHDDDLRNFSWIVGTQTSAWILTGDEKYVRSALLHLNAWFVDTLTRMNPNMLYAQSIKGICTGRGIGIIDAGQLMDIAQSVLLLQKSSSVSGSDIAQIKEWFSQFIAWLTTHPYGIDEMNAKNNHGTWWHAQVASYARLTGDQKVLQLCRDHYKKIILPNQMASDGSFPEELSRTKPYSYSLFNLDAMASMLWILSEKSVDDWNYTLPDGRGLRKGLNYMLPFLKDKTKWTGAKDVDHWEVQPEPRQFMLFAALAGNDSAWFDLWKSLAEKKDSDESRRSMMLKNPLLWIQMNDNNTAFSFAAPKIILKLDDLSVKNGECAFAPTMDYLLQKQIKAGLGIIAGRNDRTALKTLRPYLQATNPKGEKLIEIWHHGLDHSKTEFRDSTYEYQKLHFEQADKRIKKLLGIQMHTFGTPYNASDSVTNKVISGNPNYKVFMLASRKPALPNGVLYLDNRVNMENGTGNPEFSFFMENYTKLKGKYTDYMVLQGHPNMWSPERIEQFKKIIDFLISEGCEFVLPYEYFLSQTTK